MNDTGPPHKSVVQVQIATHWYLVVANQIDWMASYDPRDPPATDTRGRPIHYVDLGERFHAQPLRQLGHLLGVNFRRRSVALTVARIADLYQVDVLPLAPIMAERLTYRWVSGVSVLADQPQVVLDLRQIAADCMLVEQGIG